MPHENSKQSIDYIEEARLKSLTHRELIEEIEVHLDNTSYSSLQGEMSIRFMKSILLLNQCLEIIMALSLDNNLSKKAAFKLISSIELISKFAENGSRVK